MKRIIVGLLAGIALIVGIAACTPAKTTVHVNASESAAAKSNAAALAKCLPQSPLAQIQMAQSLTTHSGRETLEDKCGIPPAHKQAFEASVLSAAESGHLTTSAGRTAFFSVTLPKIVEENQG